MYTKWTVKDYKEEARIFLLENRKPEMLCM